LAPKHQFWCLINSHEFGYPTAELAPNILENENWTNFWRESDFLMILFMALQISYCLFFRFKNDRIYTEVENRNTDKRVAYILTANDSNSFRTTVSLPKDFKIKIF
jgi:hypothetical protein